MKKTLNYLKNECGIGHFLILGLLAILLGFVTIKASNLSQYIPFLNNPTYTNETLDEAEAEYEEDEGDLDDDVYEVDFSDEEEE